LVMGDILVTLDSKSTRDTADVQAFLFPEYVGKTVRASIIRGGALMEIPIVIGERP